MTHFYADINGQVTPKHFVPMAKDPSRTRPSRITDAKKAAKTGEIWYPSVTSILSVLDKPALINWKIEKHLEQAHAMPHGLSLDEYISDVKRKTSEALEAAPKAGTDIHKVLENNLLVDRGERDDMTEIEHLIVGRVRESMLERGIDISWNNLERYFISKIYGYAGCADVATGDWVIDYKSKQDAAKFKPGKMAYPEHYRQLSAYGHALCDEGFRAANIFICLETGEVDFHEHSQNNLEKGWQDFLDCLSIYKRNTYEAGVA